MVACALLYPYAFTGPTGVVAGTVFILFFINGATGIIPIYLFEMLPSKVRVTTMAITSQLALLVTASYPNVHASMIERYTTTVNGKPFVDMPRVLCIFVGTFLGWIVFSTLMGPETLANSQDVGSDVDDMVKVVATQSLTFIEAEIGLSPKDEKS